MGFLGVVFDSFLTRFFSPSNDFARHFPSDIAAYLCHTVCPLSWDMVLALKVSLYSFDIEFDLWR